MMAKRESNVKSGKAARHQEEKRERAEERQVIHTSLSIEEKLAKLDERPGDAKKERAKYVAEQIKGRDDV